VQPEFLQDDTLHQGYIHKLITIDTPHLGSPVALALLSAHETTVCLATTLAEHQRFPLAGAIFGNNNSAFSGAMTDLAGDSTEVSAALSLLHEFSLHPVPTAMIAGTYERWDSLGSRFGMAEPVRNWALAKRARSLTLCRTKRRPPCGAVASPARSEVLDFVAERVTPAERRQFDALMNRRDPRR